MCFILFYFYTVVCSFHFGCFAHVGIFTFGNFCGVMLVIFFYVLLGGFVFNFAHFGNFIYFSFFSGG